MLIYLDLDTNRLVMSPGNAGLVSALAAPRGSGPTLRVMPLRGGQAVPLPSGFEMTWTVKKQGDWGGDMMAYAEDFANEDGTTIYSCPVNYETAALDTLLDIGETTEKDAVSLLAQLAWRPSESAAWRPTQTVGLVLHNSVWRGVPGAPEPGPSAFTWLVGILAAAPGIVLVDDTEAQTITIGLALEAGPGIALEVDGNTITVSQDIIVKVKDTAQEYDSDTPADDDDLQFAAEAGATYEVKVNPLVKLTDPDLVALVAQWGLPAGAVVYGTWKSIYQDGGPPIVTMNGPMDVFAGIFEAPLQVDFYGVDQECIIIMGETAGDVKLQFAVGTPTTNEEGIVGPGSYLIARRIA